MAKRSDFERVDKDFYRTFDTRAGDRLAPFLRQRTRFIEPCAGAGDLMAQLYVHGHSCEAAWDKFPQDDCTFPRILPIDALDQTISTHAADCYITNPPWTREILHTLIEHLSSQLPTWLLFDADWAHTKQARPYLTYCHHIISVGRLKWIPGTTMSGKDNVAWYLFDQQAEYFGTQFIGRK